MKYNSYNGDPAFKEKMVAQAILHQQLEEYRSGTYRDEKEESFKGCSVGLTLYDIHRIKGIEISNYGDHKLLADSLGVPEFVCRLQDTIFEGLPTNQQSSWTQKLLKAIPCGVDLSPALPKFLSALQEQTLSKIDKKEFPDVYSAILQVIGLLKSWSDTGVVAESAVKSARSAIRSAEWSAEALKLAEWATVSSAEWATVRSVRLAVRSATAEYKCMADTLVKILANIK